VILEYEPETLIFEGISGMVQVRKPLLIPIISNGFSTATDNGYQQQF
jgi:hypothetical protein